MEAGEWTYLFITSRREVGRSYAKCPLKINPDSQSEGRYYDHYIRSEHGPVLKRIEPPHGVWGPVRGVGPRRL